MSNLTSHPPALYYLVVEDSIRRIQRKRKPPNVLSPPHRPPKSNPSVSRTRSEILPPELMISLGSASLLNDIAVDEESADQLQKETVLLCHDPSVWILPLIDP